MADVTYPIVVISGGEDGGFIAFVPDLQGCIGDGETPEAAVIDAKNAIAEWLEEASRLDVVIPSPGESARRSEEEVKNLRELIEAQDEALKASDRALDNARQEIDAMKTRMKYLVAPIDDREWGRDIDYLVAEAQARSKRDGNLPH